MTIKISDQSFDGPFSSSNDLMNKSGIYVVLYKNSSGTYSVLDVGESEDVKERIETHDRSDCWKRNSKGDIYFAAFYVDETNRMSIESKIRQRYDPVCGKK